MAESPPANTTSPAKAPVLAATVGTATSPVVAPTVSSPVQSPVFKPGPSTAEPVTKPIVQKPVVPVPDPSKPVAKPVQLTKKQMAAPAKPAMPEGWWKISSVKGSKAGVTNAVNQTTGIQAHWLAAIQAELAGHPSTAFTIDAHKAQENVSTTNPDGTKTTNPGTIVLNITIKPLAGFVG